MVDESQLKTLGIPYWEADGTAVHFLGDAGFISRGSLDELRYMPLATGIAEVIWPFERGVRACAVLSPERILLVSLEGSLHDLRKSNGLWTETVLGEGIFDSECLAYSPQHDCIAALSEIELVIFSATDATKYVTVPFDVIDDLGYPTLKSVAWHASLNAFFVVSKEGLHLVSPTGERKTLLTTTERMLAAVFSPPSRTVLWCTENGRNITTLHCANLDSIGTVIWTDKLKTFDNIDGSSDGKLISAAIVITEQTETIVLGVETKIRRYSMSGEMSSPEISLDISASGLAVAPDESVIVVGGRSDKCYCYNWDGTARFPRTAHQGFVSRLEYSSDGRHLYTGFSGPEFKCWDLAKSDQVWGISGRYGIIDGWRLAEEHLVACTADYVAQKMFVSVIDAATGEIQKRFRAGVSSSYSKCVGLGNLLVIVHARPGDLSTIEIWNPELGQRVGFREVSECKWLHLIAEGDLAVAADNFHLSVIQFESGSLKVSEMPLPSQGYWDGIVQFVDPERILLVTQKGTHVGQVKEKRWKKIEPFASTPRKCSPVRAGRIAMYYEDTLVEVRETSEFKVIWSRKMDRHYNIVSGVALSPDGKQLAIGVHDGTIKLVDLP